MYDIFVKLLEKKGVSTYQVAKATGITQTTFSEWKRGKIKMPNPDNLQRIAAYFNVTVDYLMGREKIQSEENTDNEVNGVYFSLAKEFQDNKIAPEDVRKVLELIKQLRNE